MNTKVTPSRYTTVLSSTQIYRDRQINKHTQNQTQLSQKAQTYKLKIHKLQVFKQINHLEQQKTVENMNNEEQYS